MTLTKNQRQYRQRKKRSQTDTKMVRNENNKVRYHVAKKQITLRVTQQAYDRLKQESKDRGLTMSDLLTRMINLDLPRYSTNYRGYGNRDYAWLPIKDEEVSGKKRRARNTETKRLALEISSTAINKLTCRSNETGRSMSRLAQEIILDHQFATEEMLRRARENDLKWRNYEPGPCRMETNPLTPEELAEFDRKREEYEAKRKAEQDAFWANLMPGIVEAYQAEHGSD